MWTKRSPGQGSRARRCLVARPPRDGAGIQAVLTALLIWLLAALPAGLPVRAQAADPEKGLALFGQKGCARCHLPRGQQGSGPALEDLRRPQGEMQLTGRLWNHLPGMVTTLARGGAEWPRIDVAEMADLMAYLRAEPSRDPEPDLYKGQIALLRKGCLKCHSLRREGGPVRPDLAEKREDYESAAAWAVTMWSHNPRMAAMAQQRGIPYPLFFEDEMVNLLGFLRSAAFERRAPDRPR